VGTLFSFIAVVFGSIFQTIQCTQSPDGASGSFTTRARLFVFSGVSEMRSGGLIFSASQVYLAGILWLFSNAVLNIFMVFELMVCCLRSC